LPTLRVVPAIAGGGLRTVQAAVNPYTAADVNHVVVRLFSLAGNAETAVKDPQGNALSADAAKADLANGLDFGNLHADTTYRVRGYAYKAAGVANPDKISADDQSFVDVKVERDDRPTVKTLTIQIADRLFAAQATTSVGLKDGLLLNGCEAIGLDPAAFRGVFRVQGC
jgi:hypothetical protein